jgi:hypothetical protein
MVKRAEIDLTWNTCFRIGFAIWLTSFFFAVVSAIALFALAAVIGHSLLPH